MNTEYDFVKQINTIQLLDEINTGCLPVPERIDTIGTDVQIFFTDALTDNQEVTLKDILNNHIANPNYVSLLNQQKIIKLLGYLNNPDLSIANIARTTIVANIASKMPPGLIDIINIQIAKKLGS